MRNDPLFEELKKIIELTDNFIIVCFGNEILADDGIGIYIGEKLIDSLQINNDKILIVHNVPVSFLGKIIKISPEHIIIIDAIDMGERSGTIAMFSPDSVPSTDSTTTHYQELDDFLEFLERELKYQPEVTIIGIQLENTILLDPMSDEIKNSGDKLVDYFLEILDNR